VPESLLQDHPATTADEPIEDAELLDEVLAQLPAHEAETLRLVARGLTFDEVAKLQNEPKATIYGRFMRSRKRVLHLMEVEG
jgi:DNA-directed RNA polymerase specialized sigma24 family protein